MGEDKIVARFRFCGKNECRDQSPSISRFICSERKDGWTSKFNWVFF